MQLKSIFVAIVGKPNVGKSTLLNALVREKTSIVSPKPQTTRTRITGILTEGPIQYVFIDTPGFHKAHNKLDEKMNRTIQESLTEVDAVLMLFEAGGKRTAQEQELVDLVGREKIPAIALLNKTDLLKSSGELPVEITALEQLGVFAAVEGISAVSGQGCEKILTLLEPYAVDGPHFFPADSFTDIPEKQLVAEIVREKILLFMREEIPHGTAVEVERFKERPDSDIIDIDVVIYCERKSHKGMIIGKGGQMLKRIASAAREDSERLLGARVNMQCWVKVKADWRDDENKLKQLGFSR